MVPLRGTAAEAANRLTPGKPKKKVNKGFLKVDAISIPLIQDTNSKA
jgi:hypothetical protein